MKLSLTAIAALDPRAVPLPHGTEVTTRVDRLLDAPDSVTPRRIPLGAVGRVVGGAGDAIEVMVVGMGRARYRRDELLPRKSGQLRYAHRRAALWELLAPCTVLTTTVGSRAWGLAEASSDTDTRGMFALPLPWTVGLAEREQDLASADGSTTLWEVEKAIRQAIRADPNTLETLFVPSARALDPIGEWILAEREAFVSVEIYGSFGRYALSQLKKLAQAARLAEHRALVLEWLRAGETPTLDAVAARLAVANRTDVPETSPPHSVNPVSADELLQAKQYVKQLYRSMHDQGLLPGSEFAELVAFARRAEHQFELPRELRPKNAYNLIRLMHTAIGWLRSGTPHFEVTVGDPLRDRLLAIKRGEVPLVEVLREAESLGPLLEEARATSPLPPRADIQRADTLLRRVRIEVARRHAGALPGPLGADAPALPAISWDDDEPTVAPDTDTPESP